MRLIPIAVRRRIDFYRAGARQRWRFHGGIVGLLIGVFGFITTPVGFSAGWLTGVAGTLLSVVLFGADLLDVRRGQVRLVAVDPPPVLDAFTVDRGRFVRHHGEVAVVDDDVDSALASSRATVTWNPTAHDLPRALRPHLLEVLRRRGTSLNVFNGKVIRQDDDLTGELLRADGEVRVSETTYFNLLVTNYMDRSVWSLASRRCLFDPRAMIARDDGSLRPFAESQAANVIGVSTLAMTKDGKVLVVLQSGNSESGQGELAPSGSGSLDLRDVRRLRGTGRHELLLDLVRRGMQRELREEANLRQEEIDWTEVIGFFRWMNKGGKPEYVGFTKLNVTSDDLADRHTTMAESPFVADIRMDATVDLEALMADPESATALTVPDLSGHLSFPLFMCLRRLGLALSRDAELRRRVESLQRGVQS